MTVLERAMSLVRGQRQLLREQDETISRLLRVAEQTATALRTHRDDLKEATGAIKELRAENERLRNRLARQGGTR